MSYVFILLFLPPTFLFFCFCSQLNSHTLHSRSCLSIILSLLCSTALLSVSFVYLFLYCPGSTAHWSFRPLSHIALYKINIFPSMSSFSFSLAMLLHFHLSFFVIILPSLCFNLYCLVAFE